MFLAYLNEAFMICSAIALVIGWVLIRRHEVRKHRRLMLTAAALGVAFFVTYVLKTLIVGDATFGGPAGLKGLYGGFLQVHATLATVAAVLGILTIRFAFRRRFHRHRRLAPWTAVLWLIAAASGLIVFLLLYIIFPTGPTTNVIRAISGH